jgi:hypothetical protein
MCLRDGVVDALVRIPDYNVASSGRCQAEEQGGYAHIASSIEQEELVLR